MSRRTVGRTRSDGSARLPRVSAEGAETSCVRQCYDRDRRLAVHQITLKIQRRSHQSGRAMRAGVVARVLKLRRAAERSWSLYRLSRAWGRVTEPIVHSVNSVLRRRVTPEERAWVERIEHLRAEMSLSTMRIVRTDYGAGTPGSKRTPETMRAGVEVTQALGEISAVASKSPFWCLLLFHLVRTLRPKSCIEMGTAVGISAAYQAAALELNGRGSLATLEGAATLASVARDNLDRLGLGGPGMVEVVVGRFEDTLRGVLASRQPIDYVFVDGHHHGPATLAYFEQMVPFLAEASVVIFDDIAWSDDMRKTWSAIAHDERVGLAIDLGEVGICVVGASMARHRHFKVPLP